MSRSNLVGLLVACAAAITGCQQIPNSEVADQAAKELGVPVFVWAFDNDECVANQFSAIYQEWQQKTPAEQDAITKQIASYDALIVESSLERGEVSGAAKEIQLLKKTFWRGNVYVASSKVISDSRPAVDTSTLTTQLEKGRRLVVRPSMAFDNSERTVYTTFDEALYNAATADSISALDDAVKSGKAQIASTGKTEKMVCGAPLSIADVLN